MLTIALFAGLSGACAGGAYVRPSTGARPGATASDAVPKGTLLSAQLDQPLSTARSRPGDRFTAELLDPLTDASGREVVARGAVLEGIVRGAEPASGGGEPAHLELQLLGVREAGEGVVPLPAEVATAPLETASAASRTLLSGLAGLAAGAGAGLAIDHTESAVVLGASLVGAGLGALVGYALGPRDATLPGGSILNLRTTEDLRIEKPIASALFPVKVPPSAAPVAKPLAETRNEPPAP